MKADEVIGKKLVVDRAVTVYHGSPDSVEKTTWPAGFVTPAVYSYIEEPDGVYWIFETENGVRLVKHEEKKLGLHGSGVGNPINLIDDISGRAGDLADSILGRGFDLLKIVGGLAGIYFAFVAYKNFT